MEIQELAQLLTAQNKTVSVAEACTCGLVGYLLSTVPGSSHYFPGGVIAYSGGLKQRLLGVPDALYDSYGSVSREMAIAMAREVRELTGTHFGLSTTGVTGPAPGRSGQPVGTFFLGLSERDGPDLAIQIHVPGDREGAKRGAAQAVLDLLGRQLRP